MSDNLGDYDPMKNGVVVAAKIYLDNGCTMADLVFAYGGMVTICWANPIQKKQYESGINGYTLFYDERPKKEFNEWIE